MLALDRRTVPFVLAFVVVASALTPAHGQVDDAAKLLKDKGLTKVKGRYVLTADEADAFQANRQAVDAFEAAESAIGEAVAAGLRNESIAGFRQRIAFDRSLVSEMRLAMRDGETLDEQEAHRSARNDMTAAKRKRAQMGLAREKTRPREQKQLERQAEAACGEAQARFAELSRKVGEVAARYRELGADAQVRAAAGASKVGPSERFDRLALRCNESTKAPKPSGAGATASPGSMPKAIVEAIDELTAAAETLRGLPFKKASPEYENRVQRRDETVEAVESAIRKLKQGEPASDLVAEASRLHDGYTLAKRMAPPIRRGIEEARASLARASKLLQGE